MRWIAVVLVLLLALPSRADTIDCQNHDSPPDLRPEQVLSCRHPDHAKIRAAARRFCARATGKKTEPRAARSASRRDRCEQVKPLLVRCRCPIELHASVAWLGGDPDGHELFWGVELRAAKRGWTVTDVVFDDYERP